MQLFLVEFQVLDIGSQLLWILTRNVYLLNMDVCNVGQMSLLSADFSPQTWIICESSANFVFRKLSGASMQTCSYWIMARNSSRWVLGLSFGGSCCGSCLWGVRNVDRMWLMSSDFCPHTWIRCKLVAASVIRRLSTASVSANSSLPNGLHSCELNFPHPLSPI